MIATAPTKTHRLSPEHPTRTELARYLDSHPPEDDPDFHYYMNSNNPTPLRPKCCFGQWLYGNRRASFDRYWAELEQHPERWAEVKG